MEQDHTKKNTDTQCPICGKLFGKNIIETHVNKCIFLNSNNESTKRNKRPNNILDGLSSSLLSPPEKKKKTEINQILPEHSTGSSSINTRKEKTAFSFKHTKEILHVSKNIPLADKMRPKTFEEYVGQSHILHENSMLRKILEKNEIPNMILWGPPGVGKTSLAHILANRSKQTECIRFVQLSATMAGVNDVKKAAIEAKNELKFGRKTIVFMDEIHRFNKLQQDIFLPHVECGVITLIGATTENPSFSLNSALLSRCRVIVLEKLNPKCITNILKRSLKAYNAIVLNDGSENSSENILDFTPRISIEESSLHWLSEISDGDARIALNSLQLALESVIDTDEKIQSDVQYIPLSSIKDGIKRSHMLYDRLGDQHYDMISALHKSIRASDDNAAMYWCTRMIVSGEDPRYICRRLVRAASEDIGLADPNAVSIALASMNAVQMIGMPESDCIVAQTAVYLARAPKNREIYDALKECKTDIENWKGPQPSVPLHLRNAPTKLMQDLNYGKGYNLENKDASGLIYMPEELKERSYFP